jgi:ABC-type multidrug transport system fused ATPase/permease subunit
MTGAADLFELFRPRLRAVLAVALLVSLSTPSSLFEPWIYRAIIDDIAGVFVAPDPLDYADRTIEDVRRSLRHLPGSFGRMFSAPLRKFAGAKEERRELRSRTPQQAIATVLVGALLLVLVRVFSEWCGLRGDIRATTEASAVERAFILRTFRHVMKLPLSYFSARASQAVARQVDQADQVAPLFTAVSKEIWPDVFSLAVILVLLISVNWELALISMLAVPVYGLVTWRMGRALDANVDRYYALWDEVSSRIQQATAGIKTVQVHGADEYEVSELSRVSGSAYDTYLRRTTLQDRYAFIQNVIIGLSKAGVLALGGVRALEHQLTPGDVVLFVAYLDRVYDPIERLTGLYTTFQQNLGSVRRAQRLLAEPPAAGTDLPPLAPGGGLVEFDRVSFGYDDRRVVLRDISFRIEPGEHVALIGPSGAGKTTIADLLAGLYTARIGDIRLDGHALNRVSPSSIHAAVRAVAADGTVFRAPIRENIRYGGVDATDSEIDEAARQAGLSSLISRLPDGLATEIGEGGVTLSAGERQRVLLARAFVAKPRVLVLDEATANLDYRTEASVKEALTVLGRGRTMLLIAHRRSMLTDVDRILVLRDGRIEQQGTPTELLGEPGYFHDMMHAHVAEPRCGTASPQDFPPQRNTG